MDSPAPLWTGCDPTADRLRPRPMVEVRAALAAGSLAGTSRTGRPAVRWSVPAPTDSPLPSRRPVEIAARNPNNVGGDIAAGARPAADASIRANRERDQDSHTKQGGITMARCDVCGNDYDKTFSVVTPDGASHVFDSIECATHRIAPTCDHCGCRILGHGVESDGRIFCCAACARQVGVEQVRA